MESMSNRETRLVQLQLYLSAERENRKLRQQRSEMWGLWGWFLAFWAVLVFGAFAETVIEFRQSTSVAEGSLRVVNYWGKFVLACLLGYVYARHEAQRCSRS